jgi:hypothetical protein
MGELGSPPAVPSNPNSRLGCKRSPIRQGWDRMDAVVVVGIDVSKDWTPRLVQLLPSTLVLRTSPGAVPTVLGKPG